MYDQPLLILKRSLQLETKSLQYLNEFIDKATIVLVIFGSNRFVHHAHCPSQPSVPLKTAQKWFISVLQL